MRHGQSVYLHCDQRMALRPAGQPGLGTVMALARRAVPVVRVGTSRLGRRGLESLQITFPMN